MNGKGEVECTVSDTGIGISEEDLPKVFDKFVQFGKKSMPHGLRGTGLGLSISKSLVESHGGQMWVESKLSEGTSFRFTIPKGLKPRKKLGEILVEDGLITKEQLEQKLKKQENEKSEQ